MKKDNTERLYRAFHKEIEKDQIEIDVAKKNFIKVVNNGLGNKMANFETYIKKEPSRFRKLISFFKRLADYL